MRSAVCNFIHCVFNECLPCTTSLLWGSSISILNCCCCSSCFTCFFCKVSRNWRYRITWMLYWSLLWLICSWRLIGLFFIRCFKWLCIADSAMPVETAIVGDERGTCLYRTVNDLRNVHGSRECYTDAVALVFAKERNSSPGSHSSCVYLFGFQRRM